ncbi:hypothetical protein [Nocardia sp. BMG111209]|uniref:hypothetical protein n=1 Tax=Nocardia sp. BMG111209 TaxID=1160137 RepID=UPI000362773D|nr:hypothetical protein [Nocardia sp. BMG111209]
MSGVADVLTRSEYNRKKKFRQAGTAAELNPETVDRFKLSYPDWKGKHWHVSPGRFGLYMGPVNLTRDPQPGDTDSTGGVA